MAGLRAVLAGIEAALPERLAGLDAMIDKLKDAQTRTTPEHGAELQEHIEKMEQLKAKFTATRDKCRAYVVEAMESEKEMTRIKAAIAVLDRAVQAQQAFDFEARLAAIEATLLSQGRGRRAW